MFALNAEQVAKANAWITEKLKDKAYTGAAGGRFTYEFTPTGIGTFITLRDFITKDNIDLSDSDSF